MANDSDYQLQGEPMEEVAGEERSSRHQPRTRRDVRGSRELNVPRDVRQALGHWSAFEIMEACACTNSDTR